MQEIKCPKCNTVFTIDDSTYESILKQIRDKEFIHEIELREKSLNSEKESALKELKLKKENEFKEELAKKDLLINDLKNKIKIKDTESELKIKDALIEKDKEIDNLSSKLELNKQEFLLKEKNIKESYEEKIKTKEEQISYYKDFKAKQSTKMIGESLEVHCHNEFNKLRPLFKNAYFEKDNDIKTGSKGDFIFRDYDDDNTEIVSIMFEMKNESDTTATKHKNEYFLKELDKYRK